MISWKTKERKVIEYLHKRRGEDEEVFLCILESRWWELALVYMGARLCHRAELELNTIGCDKSTLLASHPGCLHAHRKRLFCTTGGTLSQSNARQQKYNYVCSAPELRHIQKYKTARCYGTDILLGPDHSEFAGFPRTAHSKVQCQSIHKMGGEPQALPSADTRKLHYS